MGQNTVFFGTCNFITEFGFIFIFAKIEGCGQKNLAATAKSVKNGAKHRTKYIKNILGQPVHTKELIYVQLHN